MTRTHALTPFDKAAFTVAASPEGSQFAAAGRAGVIAVYDAVTKQVARTIDLANCTLAKKPTVRSELRKYSLSDQRLNAICNETIEFQRIVISPDAKWVDAVAPAGRVQMVDTELIQLTKRQLRYRISWGV